MPSFKSNLDLNQNQLLNAVLQNQSAIPANPVEGQVYYNAGKKTAYLWNGSYWLVWGVGSVDLGIKQYSISIPNPVTRSGLVFVRLYQNQIVQRIDSYINSGNNVNFIVECRQFVNMKGTLITALPIIAVYNSTETTTFSNPGLPADSWLYLNVVSVDGTVGVLTITITCIIV
jgi:hypothetical protein